MEGRSLSLWLAARILKNQHLRLEWQWHDVHDSSGPSRSVTCLLCLILFEMLNSNQSLRHDQRLGFFGSLSSTCDLIWGEISNTSQVWLHIINDGVTDSIQTDTKQTSIRRWDICPLYATLVLQYRCSGSQLDALDNRAKLRKTALSS